MGKAEGEEVIGLGAGIYCSSIASVHGRDVITCR